jgi:hypothetical protein
VLWANGKTHSSQNARPAAGNIPDGMYIIVGESSHRCLEIPNSSCANGVGIQTFDCDKTDVSNNQKFVVASDGTGNYTISPAHSDLCLEVPEKISDRTPVLQNACVAGAISQKWSMTQTPWYPRDSAWRARSRTTGQGWTALGHALSCIPASCRYPREPQVPPRRKGSHRVLKELPGA